MSLKSTFIIMFFSLILLNKILFPISFVNFFFSVYTGQETKIQMNNRHAPSKMSKLEGL